MSSRPIALLAVIVFSLRRCTTAGAGDETETVAG